MVFQHAFLWLSLNTMVNIERNKLLICSCSKKSLKFKRQNTWIPMCISFQTMTNHSNTCSMFCTTVVGHHLKTDGIHVLFLEMNIRNSLQQIHWKKLDSKGFSCLDICMLFHCYGFKDLVVESWLLNSCHLPPGSCSEEARHIRTSSPEWTRLFRACGQHCMSLACQHYWVGGVLCGTWAMVAGLWVYEHHSNEDTVKCPFIATKYDHTHLIWEFVVPALSIDLYSGACLHC